MYWVGIVLHSCLIVLFHCYLSVASMKATQQEHHSIKNQTQLLAGCMVVHRLVHAIHACICDKQVHQHHDDTLRLQWSLSHILLTHHVICSSSHILALHTIGTKECIALHRCLKEGQEVLRHL
jgi:hypothetical protein